MHLGPFAITRCSRSEERVTEVRIGGRVTLLGSSEQQDYRVTFSPPDRSSTRERRSEQSTPKAARSFCQGQALRESRILFGDGEWDETFVLRPIGRRYQAVVEVGAIVRLSTVVAGARVRGAPVRQRASGVRRAHDDGRLRNEPRARASRCASIGSRAHCCEPGGGCRRARRNSQRCSRCRRSDIDDDRARWTAMVTSRALGDL